jgi:hypothetical protein
VVIAEALLACTTGNGNDDDEGIVLRKCCQTTEDSSNMCVVEFSELKPGPQNIQSNHYGTSIGSQINGSLFTLSRAEPSPHYVGLDLKHVNLIVLRRNSSSILFICGYVKPSITRSSTPRINLCTDPSSVVYLRRKMSKGSLVTQQGEIPNCELLLSCTFELNCDLVSK